MTTALVQAALGAARTKGTYYKDKYWKLKARRGPMRAAFAVAHHILIAAYHMLATGADHRDLGDDYLAKRSPTDTKRGLVRKLERLGFRVTLEKAAA